jgi:DNA-directed RNA polymerase beta subunit
MLAHGVAGFLKERMFEASDAYRLHVCGMYVLPPSSPHSSVGTYTDAGRRFPVVDSQQLRISKSSRSIVVRAATPPTVSPSSLLFPIPLPLLFSCHLSRGTTPGRPHTDHLLLAVVQVLIPYAAKLLFQELQSMNIACRFGFEDDAAGNASRQSAVM